MVELLGGSPLSTAVRFDSDNLRMGSQALEETKILDEFIDQLDLHLFNTTFLFLLSLSRGLIEKLQIPHTSTV